VFTATETTQQADLDCRRSGMPNTGAVVECLLTAAYTRREIAAYLQCVFGLTAQEAASAVLEVGPGTRRS
jgi:hypothetical protein